MSDVSIKVIIDGKELSTEQVREIEHERIKHVFAEMHELGATLLDANGKSISLEKALALGFEDAKQSLIKTKLELGPKRILQLYKNPLAQTDALWHEVSAHAEKGSNMQPCIVEMDVDGVTIGDFIAYNRYLNTSGDTTAPLYIHPEHFVFEAKDGGQVVMENVGTYKEPTYQFLKMDPHAKHAIPEDADTVITLATDTGLLMSDKTDMKMMGMHQFKAKKGGMRVKLGIFFPESAPKEMVEGHKKHLAVEFTNAITAAGNHRSFMGKVLNFAITHKKRQ